MPASSASSISTTPSPVFPEPVMPRMTPWVVRSPDSTTSRSLARLARLRVETEAEVEISHRRRV